MQSSYKCARIFHHTIKTELKVITIKKYLPTCNSAALMRTDRGSSMYQMCYMFSCSFTLGPVFLPEIGLGNAGL